MTVQSSTLLRSVVAGFALVLFAVIAPSGAVRADERAGAFIASLTESAIADLTDESVSQADRERRFRDLFRQNFDGPAIARFVLGRYWRSASEAERNEFVQVFEDVMVNRFGPQFAGYGNTEVEVGVVRALEEEKQYLVRETIRLPQSGKPVILEWRVHESGGHFKVLDIVAEGVSMALTLRSEYGAVIKNSGGQVAALTKLLRDRLVNSDTAG